MIEQRETLPPSERMFRLNAGHASDFLRKIGLLEPSAEDKAQINNLELSDLIGESSRLTPEQQQFYLGRISQSPYGLYLGKDTSKAGSFWLTINFAQVQTAFINLKDGAEPTVFDGYRMPTLSYESL